eukprot:4956253-Amphidinium_carterae.1
MQTQTANFPNSTGPRQDCGQVDPGLQPPGLGTPMPNGLKPQTVNCKISLPMRECVNAHSHVT